MKAFKVKDKKNEITIMVNTRFITINNEIFEIIMKR